MPAKFKSIFAVSMETPRAGHASLPVILAINWLFCEIILEMNTWMNINSRGTGRVEIVHPEAAALSTLKTYKTPHFQVLTRSNLAGKYRPEHQKPNKT